MGGSDSKNWFLLAAGSKGWENYRHQADVCHAYQTLHQNGIPDKQIVVMMYDDIAFNEENPFQGNIINVPNGPNVYPGVPKDYTGNDVTPENFSAVLRGDPSSVKKRGPKKFIQSGENDFIFIYLSDHGGQGVFSFPNSTLYAFDLIETVKAMTGKFSKMVIFIEACNAGSMLEDLSKLDNVYAVAASSPDESSFACFKDDRRNAFLADAFSAFWLHFIKSKQLSSCTFDDLFQDVKAKVKNARRGTSKNQTLCHYGDMDMRQLKLSIFFGECPDSIQEAYRIKCGDFQINDVVKSEDVPLLVQNNRIKNERNAQKRQALQRSLEELIRKRNTMDVTIQTIEQHFRALQKRRSRYKDKSSMYKLKVVAENFRTTVFNWEEDPFVFTQSHRQILVNLCESDFEIESITMAIAYARREIQF